MYDASWRSLFKRLWRLLFPQTWGECKTCGDPWLVPKDVFDTLKQRCLGCGKQPNLEYEVTYVVKSPELLAGGEFFRDPMANVPHMMPRKTEFPRSDRVAL